MLNNQSYFDKVVNHFGMVEAQLAREPDSNKCYYRDPEDRDNIYFRCAIGCVMPDEIYRPEMEEKPVDTLLINVSMRDNDGILISYKSFPELVEFFEDCDLQFLLEMQRLHDKSQVKQDFFVKMYILAKMFGIDRKNLLNVYIDRYEDNIENHPVYLDWMRTGDLI